MFCNVQQGFTDVKVKGMKSSENCRITIPFRGPVKSIKFSGGTPRILSIQTRHERGVRHHGGKRRPRALSSSETAHYIIVLLDIQKRVHSHHHEHYCGALPVQPQAFSCQTSKAMAQWQSPGLYSPLLNSTTSHLW